MKITTTRVTIERYTERIAYITSQKRPDNDTEATVTDEFAAIRSVEHREEESGSDTSAAEIASKLERVNYEQGK
jgi:hypothetical protein